MVAKIFTLGWLKITAIVLVMVIFGAAATSILVANIRQKQQPNTILKPPQAEKSPPKLPSVPSIETTSEATFEPPSRSPNITQNTTPPPQPSLSSPSLNEGGQPLPSQSNQPSASTSVEKTPKPEGLVRHYPDFIKCSWVPQPLLGQVATQLEEVKKLGMNTICVMTSFLQFDKRLAAIGEERLIAETQSALEKIKQAGLALFLVPDVPGNSDELAKITPTEFLAIADQEALKWAAVAEKNQVEYFAPHNELSSRLDGPPQWFGETEAERLRRINLVNDWHAKILPKIRKVFSGKVVAKFGTPEKGSQATGYDYTGLTVGHDLLTDVSQFRTKVKTDYQITIEIARGSQNAWLVTELYLAYEEPGGGDVSAEYEKRKAILKDLQDDYFTVSIEEFQSLSTTLQPKGYMPVGFGPGTFSTLNQAAFDVIRNFFL